MLALFVWHQKSKMHIFTAEFSETAEFFSSRSFACLRGLQKLAVDLDLGIPVDIREKSDFISEGDYNE
jgi:hypothetical protein